VHPFRNILFPTDFSPRARAALKYAAAFARDGNGRVVVFSAQGAKVPDNLLTLPEDELERSDNRWLIQIRADVNDLLRDPLFSGLDVDPQIVEGEPVSEIARAVVDHEIDLVVVVTQSRKGLSRAWGASIAEEIVAETPCPVLTIRPPQKDFVGTTEIKLKRILLATNFRPSSAAATQVATQLAKHVGADLHAVYVIGDYFEQLSMMFPEGGLAALTRLRGYVQERLSRFARPDGPRALTHIGEGRPYEEIVRLAADNDADLIVIGTAVHTSLFAGSPVLGSEVERVIRNAPCPVLCVPGARVLTPLPALVTQPA
jgi:nucleotide-binding universal stress UspA family protein